ncbi:hypothetical protein [Sandarakinorhabdus glacialis]|uniref:hypothetical protein n=1 Tax=Sandarakinorhabdus glacialis TaxID=1614636 RepID=UPI00166CDA20|nr:hypothetical protein [Polymorphobacter glacialis]
MEFLLMGAAALMSLGELEAKVEEFAGRPAMVDPRLVLPGCAGPELAWSGGGTSVRVRCPSPPWAVYVAVPVVAEAAVDGSLPAIRRGERVVVEAEGEGFVVAIEAVAEADSRGARVPLKAVPGGRRMLGVVGADGRVRIHGLNAMVNSR